MRNYLTFIAIFCVACILGSFEIVDKERTETEIYLQKAQKTLFLEPGESIEYAQKALSLARTNNDSVSIAKAYYLKGVYNVYAGNIEAGKKNLVTARQIAGEQVMPEVVTDCYLEMGEIAYNNGAFEYALAQFFTAAKTAKKHRYKAGECRALNFIGKYHYSKGNYNRSFNYYKEALFIAGHLNDTEETISIINNLGKQYETLGSYEKALEHFLKAYELSAGSKNLINIATTYNHLGNLYEDLADYNKAKEYHSKALTIRKRIQYKEGIAKSEKNLGEIYESIESLDTAINYYLSSYQRCYEIGYKKGMVKSLYLSANIFRKQGQLKKAEENYLRAIAISEEIGYQKGNLNTYLNLGKLYKTLDKPEEAKNYLLKGIAVSAADSLHEFLKEFYYEMYLLNKSDENYRSALVFYQKYAENNQYFLDIEKQRNIEELKIAFEYENQEQTNKILRQENELKTMALQRQTAILITAIASLVVLILLVFLIWHRFKLKVKSHQTLELLNKKITRKNKELRRLNKELDKASKEKDKFFSIIAHELRNPLWWFKNLSETLSKNLDSLDKVKLHKAVNALNDSAKTAFHLSDNLMQWSRTHLGRVQYSPAAFKLDELIEQNKNVFHQEIEFKNIRLTTNIATDNKVFIDKQSIDTVLRNLISNAIKYTPDGGEINILAIEKDDHVYISVADTGIGISEKAQKQLFNPNHEYTTLGLYQEKGSGLGLLLCKEFIEMNKGTILLESREGKGTCITISLPLAMENILVP